MKLHVNVDLDVFKKDVTEKVDQAIKLTNRV